MNSPYFCGLLRASKFSPIAFLILLALTAMPANAAGLLVAEGGFGGLLEIKEQSVDVTINNGIAVTTVEQTFVNKERRVVEALYTFPVPEGASVANFSMWINGKEMIGEVVEKERAREIYESYKPARVDPGLLEQVDYKTFEMRIFPIAADAEQRVRISYYQQLDMDHDRATYVYPLTTTTRHDVDQSTTGEFSFSMRVLSPVSIIGMESPSHKDSFVFASHTDKFFEASLETHNGDLSRDVVLTYETSRPETGVDLITSTPAGEDGYFMATITAGEELEEASEPMDYVFVLDISGSMRNGGKLNLSRDSIAAFIESLAPEDRFELISFNLQPNFLFNELRNADSDATKAASRFLDSQKARGGTVLGPAMRAAYKYGHADRPLNVVILSDGMTEQNERAALLQSIRERPDNATVFAIGVGNDVNRPLLSQLAEDAGGLADFISSEDNFQQKSEAFRRKLTRPAATNVKVSFTGVDAYDIVPNKIPNLYHGMPIHIFGRYRKPNNFAVTYSAEVLGRRITNTQVIPLNDKDNPEIERMWAWNRIQQLAKESRRSGESEFTKSQIVDLGELYSIVTEHTSFLVLENNNEYRRWKIKRRNADRIARDRMERSDIDKELKRLRDESLAGLGPQDSSGQDNSPLADSRQSNSKPSKSAPQFTYDNSQSVSTPEPSGNMLMIMGLGLLSLFRKKGKANNENRTRRGGQITKHS